MTEKSAVVEITQEEQIELGMIVTNRDREQALRLRNE